MHAVRGRIEYPGPFPGSMVRFGSAGPTKETVLRVFMPIIFIAFVLLIIVAAVFASVAEKKRREAFAALAQRLGLRYRPERDHGVARQFAFLDKLRGGSNRYAYNILEGTYKGHEVMAFDYHYETHSTDSKGRRQTHHHHFSFFILFHDLECPELRIYPEGFFSKLGQMMGFDDIDFESVEFSKAFCVRSKDKKFAYDICHARMMEYLLRHRNLSIELEGRCVSVSADSRLKPEEVPGRLDQLVEIRELFPKYLYDA